MNDSKFNIDLQIPEDKKKMELNKNPLKGKIADTIGEGDNARDSFIYLTLKWAFISGCVATVVVAVNHWLFRCHEKVPDFMGDIKIAWDIIVPLITLALGYAFGKSRN